MQIDAAHHSPPTPEGYQPITLETSRGPIELRFYSAPGTHKAAIFVGGAGGGFDTPVKGWLYPRMCTQLQHDGIAALRVRYRHPNDLVECTLDVLAGIGFLESQPISAIALTGHSFGGAVVIQAAANAPVVRTCIALSTQTHGAAPAATLGPRCSLLFAHGLDDEVLPPDCSRQVYRNAQQPKQLLLKPGAHHGLDEWSEELPEILRQWIIQELAKPAK
jgi:alpha/beta superfamily hydrolase